MRVLDLFSGIGGFSLGLERAGMQTVAFCEIDEYCQRVLKKHWPSVPIYNDITKITEEFHGSVDLICGGYPCQPFSVSGEQRGEDDDRHLWPEMFKAVKKYRPRWVIGENVAGHINLGIDSVLSDLESAGYSCRTFVIPACSLGAWHRRDRVWIIANDLRSRAEAGIPKQEQRKKRKSKEFDDYCDRLFGGQGQSLWSSEPDVGRVVHGFSGRVDRIRALGNAVTPMIPHAIGLAIMSIENDLQGAR